MSSSRSRKNKTTPYIMRPARVPLLFVALKLK